MTRLERIVWSGCLLLLTSSAAAQAQYIAGTEPDQRPAGAPVISDFEKTAAWYQQFLTGVTPPYPASLHFLENQGAWYSPFGHPGMWGPYDIRGWHQGAAPMNSNN